MSNKVKIADRFLLVDSFDDNRDIIIDIFDEQTDEKFSFVLETLEAYDSMSTLLSECLEIDTLQKLFIAMG